MNRRDSHGYLVLLGMCELAIARVLTAVLSRQS